MMLNPISRMILAGRVALNQAWKAGRVAYRRPQFARAVLNRYEAGERYQWGDRSNVWSYVTDARFDASQATRIELVRKARYFEQNSPLIQRMADVWEQYTVGANGIILSPDSSSEEWNVAASEWLDEWSMYPDLLSLQHWACLQGLISRTFLVDGEIFILKTRGETPPYRPRVQLIEGHRVGTPPGMIGSEGRGIVDGVEIDGKGRPTGYYVQTGFDAGNYTRVPAESMVHIFEPSRTAQYRGISHFYAVLNTLHDLDDLGRLEMQVAKRLASTPDIIHTPTGEVLDDATEWDKQTENVTGMTNPLVEYYQKVFGATTKVMKVGDEYTANEFERPSVAQQWYWKYLAEQVCTGVGIPLVLVYPDSMQGTVYRGVLDTANAFFRSRSGVLAYGFHQIRNYVIDMGSRVDSRIAQKPKDWQRVSARPPRAVNVDVGRNSAAALAELKSGARTYQDWYAETGDDWKSKLEQKAREIAHINALAKKYKVDPEQISDAMHIEIQAENAPPGKEKGTPQNNGNDHHGRFQLT